MQIELMLPNDAKFPFSNPDWIFEPKWDGYRALCLVEDGSVRFMSRNKRELTKRFPELSTLHEGIKAGSAILDEDIVALDEKRSSQLREFTKQKEVVCSLFCFRLPDAEWERS